MRLRVLVPRRRRGAGLRGLIRPLLLGAVAALLVLAGCGGEHRAAPPRLKVGITESNPHLLGAGPWPAPFYALQRELAGLHPDYVRVLVDWSHLQPYPAPPVLDGQVDGCMRGAGPCLGWAGLLATLRGVVQLGAQPVLVVYGTPEWAATKVPGCERDGTTNYARMPDLGAYRQFVRTLLELGRAHGIALPWWSPWNEPNLAGFLNPQRDRCDAAGTPVAPNLYVELVRAMTDELRAAPGAHRLLLGEAAGIDAPRPKALGAAELAAALPGDVVCGAAAWSQHAHLLRIRRNGLSVTSVAPEETDTLITSVERALDAHRCPHRVPIWITETGVGDAPGACETMGARLEAWARDPRIGAAFQYTFREDPAFPVGLADAALDESYPAYGAWRARGTSGCR